MANFFDLLNLCNDVSINHNYVFFYENKTPILGFRSKKVYLEINKIKQILQHQYSNFFTNTILQVKEDCTIGDDDNFINISIYEDIDCTIDKIKDTLQLYSILKQIYFFILFLIDEFKIILYLDLNTVFISDSRIKFLIKDFIRVDQENINEVYNRADIMIKILSTLSYDKDYINYLNKMGKDLKNNIESIIHKGYYNYILNDCYLKHTTIIYGCIVKDGDNKLVEYDRRKNNDVIYKKYDITENILYSTNNIILSIKNENCFLLFKNRFGVEFKYKNIKDIIEKYSLILQKRLY